jgi:hypothetical protein
LRNASIVEKPRRNALRLAPIPGYPPQAGIAATGRCVEEAIAATVPGKAAYDSAVLCQTLTLVSARIESEDVGPVHAELPGEGNPATRRNLRKVVTK